MRIDRHHEICCEQNHAAVGIGVFYVFDRYPSGTADAILDDGCCRVVVFQLFREDAGKYIGAPACGEWHDHARGLLDGLSICVLPSAMVGKQASSCTGKKCSPF
jgi:hypothetical protein